MTVAESVTVAQAMPRCEVALRSDRGSASVWLVAVGCAVVAFAVLGMAYGGAVVARHQAQLAADMSALAAAQHAWEGRDPACGVAARIADANGGRLTACRIEGLDAVVTVTVRPAGPAGAVGLATARARAGPVVRS